MCRYHFGIIITAVAVLTFCRACQPRFKVNRFFLFYGHQAQLGGRKLFVSIYRYRGRLRPRLLSLRRSKFGEPPLKE